MVQQTSWLPMDPEGWSDVRRLIKEWTSEVRSLRARGRINRRENLITFSIAISLCWSTFDSQRVLLFKTLFTFSPFQPQPLPHDHTCSVSRIIRPTQKSRFAQKLSALWRTWPSFPSTLSIPPRSSYSRGWPFYIRPAQNKRCKYHIFYQKREVANAPKIENLQMLENLLLKNKANYIFKIKELW